MADAGSRVPSGRGLDILFLLTSLHSGGVQRAVSLFVPLLEEAGYAVGVTVLDDSRPLFLDQLAPWYVPLPRGVGGRLGEVLRVARLLRTVRPVLVVSVLPWPNLVGYFARRVSSVGVSQIAWEQNNIDENWLKHMGRLKRQLVCWALRRCYRGARRVIASSQGLARWLEQSFVLSPGSVDVIPNPVDLETIRAAPSGAFSWPEGKIRVLAAGRLVPQKDHLTLLRAVAASKHRHSITLRIAGEGRCRAALEKEVQRLEIAGNVGFLGHTTEIFPLMKSAEVFVSTSRWEGFGNVLVEAMAAGKVVISTRCDFGPEEILQGGASGVLVEVGDHEQIAIIFDEYCADRGRFEETRVRAVTRAADFGSNVLSEALIDALRTSGCHPTAGGTTS